MIEILRKYIEGSLNPSKASAQIMNLYGEESPYNSPECILRMLEHPTEKCKGCPAILTCQKQAAVILVLTGLDVSQLRLAKLEGQETLQKATETVQKTIGLVIGIRNAKTEGEIKSLL